MMYANYGAAISIEVEITFPLFASLSSHIVRNTSIDRLIKGKESYCIPGIRVMGQSNSIFSVSQYTPMRQYSNAFARISLPTCVHSLSAFFSPRTKQLRKTQEKEIHFTASVH